MAFPATLDSDFGTIIDSTDYPQAAHVNTLRRAVEGIEAKLGINSSVVTTTIDYKVNNFFASGRKVYLYENTAPTGWSIVSVTDKVLAVKGGSGSYNVTGGNTGGSFTITAAQMPIHSHVYGCNPGAGYERQSPGRPVMGGNTTYGSWSDSTQNAGSGAATYRPSAAVGIIVIKT